MRMEATGKVRIVACRKENVTIKYICQRTERAKSSIMASLAAARGLPPNVIPDPKTHLGRPRKTSTCTNFVIHRELRRNPHLFASELKEMHPDLLGKFSIRCIQHRLQKDMKLPSRCVAQKPLLALRMPKQRLQFAKRYLHWSADDGKKSCGTMNQPFSASKVARDVRDGFHSSAGWTLSTSGALSSNQHLS